MTSRDYFPLGIAAGTAFCNRKQETQVLVDNIKSGKHTLLAATRRYGKSSLALHALELSDLPFVEVDFYMARNEKVIESYVLNSVIELIGKALGPLDKLVTSIKRYVKHLKPKLDLGTPILKLELTTDSESDPATNVKESLLLLEKLLEEKQKHAVLLMDEFQNVGVIAKGMGIEGAIRHVAQKTKYLTFIFSGSNRKLLETMFEDDNRPLYKLCWKLELNRMGAEHYLPHLQKAAQQTWNEELSEAVFDKIIMLTERHPYYVNKLCDRLWSDGYKKPPIVQQVEEAWQKILAEEKSDAVKEISMLSLGQKNVVLKIAKDSTAQITSAETMLEIKMPGSSIATAVDGLLEKDVIEIENEQYQIINPVVKFYVLKGSDAPIKC